jgi:FolB domain-containing protein
MDRILIKDLLLRGIVGINDWERVKQQDILVNLVIDHDLRKPGVSDAIEDTLNYKTITKEIIQLVETSEFYLVEKLAHEVARIAIDHGAEKVIVRIEKPMALRFADSVGVEIIRERDDYV